MKNIALIFSILLIGLSAKASSASEESNGRRYDGNAYIFVEGDVEFSVFPDGQFDFVYVGPQNGSQVTINTRNVNLSFNSGYDYDAYVQYDDYGAVIQVEDVAIYYDEYGRIAQAGNVDIQYNDRRIVRVGGLHVVYNNYGYFSHCTGAINFYNPYYVYRPWHVYYARPIFSHCIVYDLPYRRYYSPVRYSYHDHINYYKNRGHVSYHNGRRDFHRPGSYVYDKKGRSSRNKDYNPNRRNTMVAQNSRSNQSVTRNSSTNSKGASDNRKNVQNTRNSGNSDVRNNKSTRNSGNASSTRKGSNNKEIARNGSGNQEKNERSVGRTNSGNQVRNSSTNGSKSERTVKSTGNNRVSQNSSPNRTVFKNSNRKSNTAVKSGTTRDRNVDSRSSGSSVKRGNSSQKDTASRGTSTNTGSKSSSKSSGKSSRGSSSRGGRG